MITRGKSLLLMLAAVVIYFVLHANVHAAAQNIAKDRKVREVRGIHDGSKEVTVKVEALDTEKVCDRVYCHVPVDAQSNWVKEIEMQVGTNIITAIGDSDIDVHTNTLKGLANNLVFIGNATGNYSNDDPNDPASAGCTIYVDYPGGTIIESESVELAGSGVATVGVKGKLIGNQIVAGLYYVYVYGGFGAGSKGTAKLTGLAANASLDGESIAGGGHNVLEGHKAPWHAFTVVIHKDEKTGGYRVVDYDSGCSTRRLRDMVNKQGYKVVQGKRGVQPFSEGYEYEVMDFHGNGKDDPIYLCVGESAQFEAVGVIEPSANCWESNIGILNQFKVESVAGETMPEYYMDGTTTEKGLGVFTGLSPGHAVVRCYYTNNVVLRPEEIDVYVVKANLVPDWNHDRVIDSEDEKKVADCKPFRFWINDDDDTGAVEDGDAAHCPGAPGMLSRQDWKNQEVDGASDLVDFFPVFIDLKETLDVIGTSGCKYILKHEGNAVNALINTGLTRGTAEKYLVDKDWCEAHSGVQLEHITADGYELPSGFLGGIVAGSQNVILLEGRTVSDKPLVLEIWKDNKKICRKEMPLSLSSVRDMYRYLNLRPAAGGTGGGDSKTSEPSNNPDSLSNDKHVVFIHGFNEDANSGLGNISETFKRLYWSGSKAKYTGVVWFGDEGLLNEIHFYADVINAFQTSSNFTQYVNQLKGNGDEVDVIAFSLGNMVVSSAIQDHSAEIDKYFMLHAAVTREAYDGQAFDQGMVHARWTDYNSESPNVLASRWHNLFGGGDHRGELTWSNRFSDVVSANTYNFYSGGWVNGRRSGDHVLEIHEDGRVGFRRVLETASTGGRFSWYLQELWKGGHWVGGSSYGGWEFTTATNYWHCYEDENGDVVRDSLFTATEMAAIPEVNLRSIPFFDPGGAGMNQLYEEETGSVFAWNNRPRLLAEMIPALSAPAGANRVDNFYENNINMQGIGQNPGLQNGWPEERCEADDWRNGRWLHGDYRTVAYVYTYKVFDKMSKEIGRFDQE